MVKVCYIKSCRCHLADKEWDLGETMVLAEVSDETMVMVQD